MKNLALKWPIDSSKKIKELGEERVAAFVAEPVQGAGGVIVPPASYWPRIKEICNRHEILLIADEVICGFGRLGEWFGSDYYDLTARFNADCQRFVIGIPAHRRSHDQ